MIVKVWRLKLDKTIGPVSIQLRDVRSRVFVRDGKLRDAGRPPWPAPGSSRPLSILSVSVRLIPGFVLGGLACVLVCLPATAVRAQIIDPPPLLGRCEHGFDVRGETKKQRRLNTIAFELLTSCTAAGTPVIRSSLFFVLLCDVNADSSLVFVTI